MAAHAQGAFWEMHDLLYANQRALEPQDLERYAEQLGLDLQKFKADLKHQVYIPDVKRTMAEGSDAGVKGTPNLFVNGRAVRGALPFEDLKALLSEEVDKGRELLANGIDTPYVELQKKARVFTPFEDSVADFTTAGDPVLGPSNATLELVIYSDFECPYCARFAATAKQLQAHYKEQAKLVFKQFPLPNHKQARPAANAALAAHAQGKFWEMHDLISLAGKELHRAKLLSIATQLGLDVEAVARAIDENQYEDFIGREMVEGRTAGVRGTPSLFVNGRKYVGGKLSVADVARAIDKHILAH